MYLLITGCGRSGTKFASHLLLANGLQVLHERRGADGISSGDLGARHSPLKSQALRWISVKDAWDRATHVFHQVRSPLPTIRSVNLISWWGFIQGSLPKVAHPNRLIKCMRYWLFWNEMCEKNASWTYRVEDFPALCTEVGKITGRAIEPKPIPTNLNTRRGTLRYAPWTWKDLHRVDRGLCRRVREKAIEYGYEEDLLYH